jgi:hypothetical protein
VLPSRSIHHASNAQHGRQGRAQTGSIINRASVDLDNVRVSSRALDFVTEVDHAAERRSSMH